MSDLTSPGRAPRVLGLAALVDLVLGIVLSAAGVASDVQPLAIAGVVLLISGGGVLAWFAWTRNKPQAL